MKERSASGLGLQASAVGCRVHESGRRVPSMGWRPNRRVFLAPRREDAKGLADTSQRGLGSEPKQSRNHERAKTRRRIRRPSPSSSFVISEFRAFVISLALVSLKAWTRFVDGRGTWGASGATGRECYVCPPRPPSLSRGFVIAFSRTFFRREPVVELVAIDHSQRRQPRQGVCTRAATRNPVLRSRMPAE